MLLQKRRAKMKSLRLTEKEKEWLMRAVSECIFSLSEEYEYDEEEHPNQKDMDYLDKLYDKIARL
tara:strand:- start:1111 stop:1305 length:195 start_codon:yes stop_codon:yes gene_type:complete